MLWHIAASSSNRGGILGPSEAEAGLVQVPTPARSPLPVCPTGKEYSCCLDIPNKSIHVVHGATWLEPTPRVAGSKEARPQTQLQIAMCPGQVTPLPGLSFPICIMGLLRTSMIPSWPLEAAVPQKLSQQVQ